MTQFWTELAGLDQRLFLLLNGANTPTTDFLFKWVTNKYVWAPLYLYLIYVVVRSYGKQGWVIVVLSVLALVLADQLASGVMKPYFERFRPCHDPLIGSLVHNTVGCGGKFGFASSHAATAFAFVTSLFLMAGRRLPAIKWLFLWAFVYAYSRVAVGVHYPGDILVGGLVGALTGIVVARMYFYFGKSLV